MSNMSRRRAATEDFPSAPTTGLRERKKAKTRETIRHVAYELFESRGYDETSVEQIAAAAEVSPSTFFRYFPTKEDVVLADDNDGALADYLRTESSDVPLIDALRGAVARSVAPLLSAPIEEMQTRIRLSLAVPVLRARLFNEQLESQQAIAAMIAERGRRDPDDLEVKCAAAAIVAAFSTAVWHWAEHGGAEDLATVCDHSLALLAAGLPL
jgi:AcrR family transcriptional regulator